MKDESGLKVVPFFYHFFNQHFVILPEGCQVNLQSWTKQMYNNYPLCKSNQRNESQWPVASMLLLLSFVVVVVCMNFLRSKGGGAGRRGGGFLLLFLL